MKKYKLVFYLLVLSFLFFPWQVVRGNTVTTGDAESFTCAENEVGTYGNYLPWFNEHCITPTPKCSPTPTVTPCPSTTVTPTPTTEPSVTPTITPKPTNTPGNGGGPGDGKSDGRSDGRSSCPECTQAPASQAIKAVLGLSTTGGTDNALIQWAELLGALGLVSTGAIFLKKNA